MPSTQKPLRGSNAVPKDGCGEELYHVRSVTVVHDDAIVVANQVFPSFIRRCVAPEMLPHVELVVEASF